MNKEKKIMEDDELILGFNQAGMEHASSIGVKLFMFLGIMFGLMTLLFSIWVGTIIITFCAYGWYLEIKRSKLRKLKFKNKN